MSDSLFESRDTLSTATRGYWSSATVYTLVCHTRLKRKRRAGRREREEREEGADRAGSFLPGHRQNKQLAIFAMHLLLNPSTLLLALSLSLFQSRTYSFSYSRTHSPAIYLLGRLYLTAIEIQSRQWSYHAIRPRVYSPLLPEVS